MQLKVVGKSLDSIDLKQRLSLTGKWIATELYSPQRLPLRIVRAVGDDARQCIRSIEDAGLDPALFEYEPVPPPYEH